MSLIFKNLFPFNTKKKSQEQRHKAENKILESNSNFRNATNLRTLKLNLSQGLFITPFFHDL
jgi:hypothetical protein